MRIRKEMTTRLWKLRNALTEPTRGQNTMHDGVADCSMNRLRWLVLVACVLASPVPANASWIFDAEAGIVHETNVGLAHKARDVKSDSRLSTALSTGIAIPFDDR